MTQTARIVKILGGEKTLGRRISSPAELIALLRAGLNYHSFEAVLQELDLSREQMLDSLALPNRTMARRKEANKLSAEESDRVYRLARTAARAEEVLGTLSKARHWLLSPNRALNSSSPISLLDTYEGTCQVEAVLGRIEYGVFS